MIINDRIRLISSESSKNKYCYLSYNEKDTPVLSQWEEKARIKYNWKEVLRTGDEFKVKNRFRRTIYRKR